MTLYRPSELRQFLEGLGKRPSKALSQNFLIDGNILQKILKTADVQPGDNIIEIGPGPGALTEQLLRQGAHVIAIEKDPLFAESLNRLQTEDNRLQIISDDFLKLDIESLISKKTKVVANIPYNITTPILTKLVPLYPNIISLTLMVQKEVAKRFVAQKGTPEYGSFTLFLQHYSDTEYAFTVEPTCFYPPPSVHSAVVHLTLKKPNETPYPETLIRSAFQQRRKMLKSSLKEYPVEEALTQMGLNPKARPEELSLNDFLELSNLLKSN